MSLQLPLGPPTTWVQVGRYCDEGARLADRHYSRRSPGDPQFVPPGRPFIMLSRCGQALWAVVHGFVPGTTMKRWRCTIFRNEGAGLSSSLIREATNLTMTYWLQRYGALPPERLTTEIDWSKVRRKRDPGRCFIRAGWIPTHCTLGGHGRNPLLVLAAPGEMERVP